MLFHSQAFLFVFLPLVWFGWAALRGSESRRETWIILASIAFISWWDWRFTPLLVGSIIVNWLLGAAILRHRGRRAAGVYFWAGVAANLAVLGGFKYLAFARDILTGLGVDNLANVSVILPIGISFYTFQQISYLADCRKSAAPAYPFRKYAYFVSFFPQLIAGPIVRHNELIPQLGAALAEDERMKRIGQGLVLFIIGLFKKIVIADGLAPHSDAVFAAAGSGVPALADAWTGLLSFALQIYFDFSAYSDMAIGLALLFGLKLPMNFNAPYRAVSMREFWRRWHMTLSRFFRDYLYIPLGGNRHGPARQFAALFVTMALCGLWHGAGWPFVLWGVWHGAGLIINRVWTLTKLPMPTLVGWALTMLFVLLGWVLFRSPDAETYMNFYRGLFSFGELFAAGGAQAAGAAPNAAILLIAVLTVLFAPTSQDVVFKKLAPRKATAAALGVGAGALAIMIGGGASVEFIYFQF